MRTMRDIALVVTGQINGEIVEIEISNEEYFEIKNRWGEFISYFSDDKKGLIFLIDGDVVDEERKYILVAKNLECQHYM